MSTDQMQHWGHHTENLPVSTICTEPCGSLSARVEASSTPASPAPTTMIVEGLL